MSVILGLITVPLYIVLFMWGIVFASIAWIFNQISKVFDIIASVGVFVIAMVIALFSV